MSARPRVSVIIPHAMRFSAADLTAFARHAEDVSLGGSAHGAAAWVSDDWRQQCDLLAEAVRLT